MNFFSFEGIPGKWIQFFFIVKLVSGLLLSLIYTHYYTNRLTADTFKYFDDSKILFELFFKDKALFFQFMFGGEQFNASYLDVSNQMNTWWNKYTIYNDARTMIRFNVLLRFISLGHYHVHAVIFNFIAFTGMVALAKALIIEIKDFKRAYVFFLFLFPSLTFWSSGLMKDGIIFFSLGFSLLYLQKYLREKKIKYVFMLVALALLLFFTKLHIFFIYVPCSVALLTYSRFNKSVPGYFLSASFVVFLIIMTTGYFIQDKTIPELISEKQHENIAIAKEVQAGSFIDINSLVPTWSSIIKNIPVGFMNTLVRPHIFDSLSPFILLSAVENIFLLILIIAAFLSKKMGNYSSPFIYFSILFVFALFSMIGIMTPVLGALVRYKIQGLPFLLFIICSMADREKMINRFAFLKPLLQNG